MKPTLTKADDLANITGVVVAVIIAMLLVSCGGHGADSHSHDTASHDTDGHDAHTAEAAPENGLDGLELDNGNKWQMDDHTRTVFAKMATSFSSSDHSALEGEGLKQVASDLRVDINELIQGCTMTGASHDQLHTYLAGYIPAVVKLSESGLLADAKTVGHYLERYGDYFE